MNSARNKAKSTRKKRSPEPTEDDPYFFEDLPQEIVSISSSDNEDEPVIPDNSGKSPSTSSSSDFSSCSDDDDDDDDVTTETKEPAKKSEKPPRSRGILVQHRLNFYGSARKILDASGQKMDHNFFSFTQEEDQKIRENWKKFAKSEKIRKGILEYLGFDQDGLHVKTKRETDDEIVFNLKMWSKLCDGLNNRYAKLIRTRTSYIFHPYFREDEDYDKNEIRRLRDEEKSLPEISETLKIPPRWLERRFSVREKIGNHPLDEDQRIFMLKLLYESMIDNGDEKFSTKNFDWRVFRAKCRENSITPPDPHTVNETYRKVFFKYEKQFFKHLTPPPTLKSKLIYVHEAYVRYQTKPVRRQRKNSLPILRSETLFTIIFEDYNKNGRWDPPVALERFAKKMNLDAIRERVQTVKTWRKRLSEAPKVNIHVIVKRRIKPEDLEEEVPVGKRTRRMTNEFLEISSIHGESKQSIFLDQSENPENSEYDEEDPLTDFELSTTTNTTTTIDDTTTNTGFSSLLIIPKNETILAAGGGSHENHLTNDTSSLGGHNLSQRSQKTEETVQLDMSQNIWDQLTQGN